MSGVITLLYLNNVFFGAQPYRIHLSLTTSTIEKKTTTIHVSTYTSPMDPLWDIEQKKMVVFGMFLGKGED